MAGFLKIILNIRENKKSKLLLRKVTMDGNCI